jgi:hypothetical protein
MRITSLLRYREEQPAASVPANAASAQQTAGALRRRKGEPANLDIDPEVYTGTIDERMATGQTHFSTSIF